MTWKPRAPTPALARLVEDLDARHPGLAKDLAEGRPSDLSRRYFLTTAQIARLRGQLYRRAGDDEASDAPQPVAAPRPRRVRAEVAADLPTLAPLKRPVAPAKDEGPETVRREAEARWPGLVDLLPRLHDGGIALIHGLNASRVAWIRLALDVPRPPRHPPHPDAWEAIRALAGRYDDRALSEAFQVPAAEVKRAREERRR